MPVGDKHACLTQLPCCPEHLAEGGRSTQLTQSDTCLVGHTGYTNSHDLKKNSSYTGTKYKLKLLGQVCFQSAFLGKTKGIAVTTGREDQAVIEWAQGCLWVILGLHRE